MAVSPPPPSGTPTTSAAERDNRFKLLDAAMKRHQYQPEALIEVLHRAQELFGYLSPALLRDIAQRLHMPPSRVYSVATFYHFFSLTPPGEHTCTVCLGTACYVKGAARILAAAEAAAGIRVGATTADNQLSILTVRCIGACGIAPTVMYDGVVTGQQTPELAQAFVRKWRNNGSH